MLHGNWSSPVAANVNERMQVLFGRGYGWLRRGVRSGNLRFDGNRCPFSQLYHCFANSTLIPLRIERNGAAAFEVKGLSKLGEDGWEAVGINDSWVLR